METPTFSSAAVAAPHRLAAETGQIVLAQGGNAVEAMVAMAATIAVAYPHMNGIGGDGFWLVREPGGKVWAFDAAGPAGRLATIARYAQKGYDAIPARGPDAAVTVAGAVAGWELALDYARSIGGKLPGRAGGVEGAHAPAGLADKPEPVASDPVHVRVGDRDRGRHRDHGLDRIAPLSQDHLAGLGCTAVGRRNGSR